MTPEAMRRSLGLEAGDGLELTVGDADALEVEFGDACASKTLNAATAIILPAPE
jgi:bifunctional DNA-binding transcriptional regulator/antitoxin component of YhaV-PrlF toxin-antitoxin module